MKILFLIMFPIAVLSQTVRDEKVITEKDWLVINANKPRNKEGAKVYIDSIRYHVISGYPFSVLAALYSEDPGSGKQGGQLPFFKPGQMVPEFENVVFKLQAGELSEVFETKFGFHIVQLMSREGDSFSARHILITYK